MELDAKDVKEIIPHRYPFLLLDGVTELNAGEKATGFKNLSINEPFFQGHFPDKPVMPGVLIVESLAQLGAVCILAGEQEEKIALFAGIDKMRFRRQVNPGDRLWLQADIIKRRGPVGKGEVRATVDDELVAEGVLTFALTEDEE